MASISIRCPSCSATEGVVRNAFYYGDPLGEIRLVSRVFEM
ncbi:IS1 family transposase [Escherichia coli]|nr:hypothetical protein [Escherichia coli]